MPRHYDTFTLNYQHHAQATVIYPVDLWNGKGLVRSTPSGIPAPFQPLSSISDKYGYCSALVFGILQICSLP